jgi:hypothetical protein
VKPVDAMQVAGRCMRIHGWFSFEAAMLFAIIDDVQRQLGIGGDCFEIGVHRGRSAVLLSHLLGPGEHLGVCDLFGEQTGNVSRSGSGDLGIFEPNMRGNGTAHDRLRVFAKASSALAPAEIGQRYRFFHVDGGHNADEAQQDLELAAACTVAGGAILLDDPFRIEWPGVTEAVVRFLDAAPAFAAVAVGFNKLLLTRTDVAEAYAKAFDDARTRAEYGLGYPWHLKTLPFLSRPLRIFHVPTRVNPNSLRARVEQLHRTQPWSRGPVGATVISTARRLLA